MLILTRKEGEEIELWTSDGPILLKVVEIRTMAGRVRTSLGFEAPDSIKIHRKEVADAIRAGGGSAPTRNPG